jgi:hypothetical protein
MSEIVTGIVANNSETLASQLSNRFTYNATVIDDDEVEHHFKTFYDSSDYRRLTEDQKKYVVKLPDLTADAHWRYGVRPSTDGLWDSEIHVQEVPFEPHDTLVLSGIVGQELVGMSKRLDRLSAVIEPDMFRRTVLIGGMAIAAGREEYTKDSEHFMSHDDDGISARTYIGGDIHGDFWTSRQKLFQTTARDPLGVLQHTAPSLEYIPVNAYHSVEPAIMRALLEYKVVYDGQDRDDLFRSLVGGMRGVSPTQAGAFGDYGHDDGEYEALHLNQRISDGNVQSGDILTSMIVQPQNNNRLLLIARETGIEFQSDFSHRSFLLPSAEIEAYALTLLQSGFGRTSQSALARVIFGLRDGKPVSS